MTIGSSIVLPLSTGNVTLAKINQDNYASEFFFKDATHQYQLRIRHSESRQDGVSYDRHNVELVETIFAAGAVPEHRRKVYFVIEQLPNDVSVVNADGLFDYGIAASNAFLTDLFGWQS